MCTWVALHTGWWASANNIAKWDGNQLVSLGAGAANGTDGLVYALAVSGSDVYVGGEFTQAGGQSANNVAMWNSQCMVVSWERSSQRHRPAV